MGYGTVYFTTTGIFAEVCFIIYHEYPWEWSPSFSSSWSTSFTLKPDWHHFFLVAALFQCLKERESLDWISAITDAAVVANSSLSGYENCYFRNAWKKLVLLRKVKKITLPAAVLSGLDIRCETKRGQGVKTQFSQL